MLFIDSLLNLSKYCFKCNELLHILLQKFPQIKAINTNRHLQYLKGWVCCAHFSCTTWSFLKHLRSKKHTQISAAAEKKKKEWAEKKCSRYESHLHMLRLFTNRIHDSRLTDDSKYLPVWTESYSALYKVYISIFFCHCIWSWMNMEDVNLSHWTK